jgi:hypothetical protein
MSLVDAKEERYRNHVIRYGYSESRELYIARAELSNEDARLEQFEFTSETLDRALIKARNLIDVSINLSNRHR